MKSVGFFVLCVLLSLTFVSFLSAETIFLEDPMIYPDTAENRAYITTVLQDASFFVKTVYQGKLDLVGSVFSFDARTAVEKDRNDNPADLKARADFVLTVNAVNQPESKVVSLNLSRPSDGKTAETVTFLGEWKAGVGDDYGRSIYYMWASIFDFDVGPDASPPEYVDEFPMDMIPKTSLPVENAQLYPYSLAVGNTGNVVVAGNSLAIEVDSRFRILGFPGKQFYCTG